MNEIEFTAEEKALLVQRLKRYFGDELDQEIGQFDAEFFLDFISKEIGVYYYNRGLSDAQDILNEKVSSISDALYELEMPVGSV